MINKITKEQFKSYLKVQNSGRINMFDIKSIIMVTNNLTKDDCLEIMKNYSLYIKKYGI